jgi:hypothetical protein
VLTNKLSALQKTHQQLARASQQLKAKCDTLALPERT